MKIEDIDHIVITTSDLQKCLDFYTRIPGMKKVYENGRYSLQFGNHKFNIHTRKAEFLPAALHPEYGSLDLCLAVKEDIHEVMQEIQKPGYPVELGPVERHGALGKMQSIYLRDPDGNLIELSSYQEEGNTNMTALHKEDEASVGKMSRMASEIVREHFDPLIGKEQNDYMLSLFQAPEAIHNQLEQGYRYYFVQDAEKKDVGFLAFYPKKNCMYLSKFYLYKSERGKGYSHAMLDFVKKEASAAGLYAIELNVNKQNDACRAYEHPGFHIIRSEKNDIGHGYFMDDYVYRLDF